MWHTFSILGYESLRRAEAESFLEENKTRVPPQAQKSSDVTPLTQSSGDFYFFSAYAQASVPDRRCARLKRKQVGSFAGLCQLEGKKKKKKH